MKPYYHPRIFERVHYALGDLFNSIELNRYDANYNIVKIIRVPIVFLYDKNIVEFMMNTRSTKKESKHSSPILGLRFNGMSPNNEGKTTTNHIRKIYNSDSNTYTRDITPNPYILSYTLSLYCENAADYFQLIEQIIPYFDNWLSLRIKEFEFNNVERDIPVQLVSSSPMFDGEEREKHRSLVMDFNLALKVDFYKPPMVSNVIRYIETNIAINDKNIGVIKNTGVEHTTVEEYNKALNEIVEVGNIANSVVVSTINSKVDKEYMVLISANRDPKNNYSMLELPQGTLITYVEALVGEAFDDLEATISIGTAEAPQLIMATSDSNLAIKTRYSLDTSVRMPSTGMVYVYYNQENATKGEVQIKISYK